MRMSRLLIVLLCVCFMSLNQARAAAPTTKPAKADGAVIAVFNLSGPIAEGQTDDSPFNFDIRPVALRDLTRRMKDAAGDDNVKAVVLLSDHLMAGRAQVEEIRQAIKGVRDKGKDVFVHSDTLMMGDYLVFSGSTRLSMSPTSDLFIFGLHGEQPYLRGMLDKLGVKPDFIHCGAYKSATELFMREGPSPEADSMMNWLFDSIYATDLQLIAEGRKVNTEQAKKWVDTGLFTAEQAKSAGLIDAVEHRQEFDAMLKKKFGESLTYNRKYGQKQQEEMDFSSPFAMFKILGDLMKGPQTKEPGKPAVGVVYVEGMILTGSGHPSPFGGTDAAYSSDIRKALDQAARDESIKAVVLRIDSGGGSAVASEIILDATRRVKDKKPLVVSMGDVAGSGGYYVACAADTIFANQSTITGSIGVLSGKLVTNDMWKKIGITFKSYNRGASAGMFSTDNLWTDAERAKMQGWMDDVYGVFKKHVTDTRGDRLKKPIDEIAGGRVYTGKQALDLGLVDKLGSLADATAFAADQAKMKEYEVRVVPEPKNFIEKLVAGASGEGDQDDRRWLSSGSTAGLAAGIERKSSLLELAAPYLEHLDPARVTAIRSALEKLQLLDREGVLLTMPETFVFN